ncbi:IQ-DOMAIN 5-RELATED [Salix viminalis]|uniref:IQ-DOMAIN 5-RELATED n=1 Tax=Salix viminalis TaxID=40686 RepID=A0A9Q0NLV9_SALVM|nr:IQ-DOMAIN 5-RELATED [Salix viminalis]
MMKQFLGWLKIALACSLQHLNLEVVVEEEALLHQQGVSARGDSFNGYSGYPNYMSNTESSRAKVRSQSAPRQRLEFEKYGSSRRSVHGCSDSDSRSERGFAQNTELQNKVYVASGYLNRLGTSNLRLCPYGAEDILSVSDLM